MTVGIDTAQEPRQSFSLYIRMLLLTTGVSLGLLWTAGFLCAFLIRSDLQKYLESNLCGSILTAYSSWCWYKETKPKSNRKVKKNMNLYWHYKQSEGLLPMCRNIKNPGSILCLDEHLACGRWSTNVYGVNDLKQNTYIIHREDRYSSFPFSTFFLLHFPLTLSLASLLLLFLFSIPLLKTYHFTKNAIYFCIRYTMRLYRFFPQSMSKFPMMFAK